MLYILSESAFPYLKVAPINRIENQEQKIKTKKYKHHHYKFQLKFQEKS